MVCKPDHPLDAAAGAAGGGMTMEPGAVLLVLGIVFALAFAISNS